MKLFFTYYGGKWRIASHYPKPMDTIIEPFAGSAGYSLRYPEKQVHLFDIDPIICGVWDYLIHVSEAEILSLPVDITHVDDANINQEAKWLIGFWLNKASTQPGKQPSKWMRSKIRPNSYWGETIKQRIASQVNLIRHWTIEQKSFADIGNENATWFIDPPYSRSGSFYKYNKIDYNVLTEYCKDRIGKVIVCEQDGADWLPFVPFRTIKYATTTTQQTNKKNVTQNQRAIAYCFCGDNDVIKLTFFIHASFSAENNPIAAAQ